MASSSHASPARFGWRYTYTRRRPARDHGHLGEVEVVTGWRPTERMAVHAGDRRSARDARRGR